MADECRPVEVDGEVVSVRGGEPMDADDRAMFAQVIRAAKAKVAERPMGTCVTCGCSVPIVNYEPATSRLPEVGYLARHHRPRTRPGTKCRGSFGSWVEKKREGDTCG